MAKGRLAFYKPYGMVWYGMVCSICAMAKGRLAFYKPYGMLWYVQYAQSAPRKKLEVPGESAKSPANQNEAERAGGRPQARPRSGHAAPALEKQKVSVQSRDAPAPLRPKPNMPIIL